MRARCLVLLALAFAACGDDSAPTAAPEKKAPIAGFLGYLPEDASIAMRLPTATTVEGDPQAYEALLRALGWDRSPNAAFFGAAAPEGLARNLAPGLALTASGGWTHFLPAASKGALNKALQPLPKQVSVQERDRWIIVSSGGKGVGNLQEEPLPAGDLGVRVRHHPLLVLAANSGDLLEVGIRVGGGGVDFDARVVPGRVSPTKEWLAEAQPGDGSGIDFIPSSLALRMETTFPPTLLAGMLTRRLGRHCKWAETSDGVLAERFLREVLTGVDPDHGIAIGVEFKDGVASFVVVAREAKGTPSPLLTKLRLDQRTSFGSLVFDARDAPDGLFGWSAWVAEAEPNLDGLPETLWPFVGDAARERTGVTVSYLKHAGWCVAGVGPRADLLARSVRAKLAYGANRSQGSFELLNLRREREGDYVLGVIIESEGLAGLPPEDRKALRAMFHAGDDAGGPGTLSIAGFRRDGILELFGRARY